MISKKRVFQQLYTSTNMWLEWKITLYIYFLIHINVYFLDTNQNYRERKLVLNVKCKT